MVMSVCLKRVCVQLVLVGGVPGKVMLGAIGTVVLWSDPTRPQADATFLGQIQAASYHDGALTDSQLTAAIYGTGTGTCASLYHSHGAHLSRHLTPRCQTADGPGKSTLLSCHHRWELCARLAP